jgi:ribosomal protein L40E
MHKLTKFARRHNSDGSYDSICTHCYATVASAGREEALSSPESAHVCDPKALSLAEQGSIPLSVPMLGLVTWSSTGADECRPIHYQKFPLKTKLQLTMTVKPDRTD